jgi:hypothetical protein
MDKEWSWNELPTVIPFVASSFAFAYVVGYFYAFDISWFTFFSLSEHLVFALRALPIAIGSSVGFLVALRYSELEHQWKWLRDHSYRLTWSWFVVLSVAAVLAFVCSHFGLSMGFLLIAFGALVYHQLPVPRPKYATAVYWAINLMVLSLVVGIVSGFLWIYFPSNPVFVDAQGMSMPLEGHVLVSGDVGALVYDARSGEVHLVRRGNINKISGCIKSSCR